MKKDLSKEFGPWPSNLKRALEDRNYTNIKINNGSKSIDGTTADWSTFTATHPDSEAVWGDWSREWHIFDISEGTRTEDYKYSSLKAGRHTYNDLVTYVKNIIEEGEAGINLEDIVQALIGDGASANDAESAIDDALKLLSPADRSKVASLKQASNPKVKSAPYNPEVHLPRKEKIKKAVEIYTGIVPSDVQIVNDPHVNGTYAIRATIGKNQVDFLLSGGTDSKTQEAIADALEEVEFTAWPPTAGQGSGYKMQIFTASKTPSGYNDGFKAAEDADADSPFKNNKTNSKSKDFYYLKDYEQGWNDYVIDTHGDVKGDEEIQNILMQVERLGDEIQSLDKESLPTQGEVYAAQIATLIEKAKKLLSKIKDKELYEQTETEIDEVAGDYI